jgi:hypothetical protein
MNEEDIATSQKDPMLDQSIRNPSKDVVTDGSNLELIVSDVLAINNKCDLRLTSSDTVGNNKKCDLRSTSSDTLGNDAKRKTLEASVESSFRSSVEKPWYHAEVERARKHVDTLFSESTLEDRTGIFPKFTQDECSLGKFLGKGSFGTVHEVKEFLIEKSVAKNLGPTEKETEESSDEDEMEGREFIARHSTRATGEARYAIKCLSTEIIENRAVYSDGVANMVIGTSNVQRCSKTY